MSSSFLSSPDLFVSSSRYPTPPSISLLTLALKKKSSPNMNMFNTNSTLDKTNEKTNELSMILKATPETPRRTLAMPVTPTRKSSQSTNIPPSWIKESFKLKQDTGALAERPHSDPSHFKQKTKDPMRRHSQSPFKLTPLSSKDGSLSGRDVEIHEFFKEISDFPECERLLRKHVDNTKIPSKRESHIARSLLISMHIINEKGEIHDIAKNYLSNSELNKDPISPSFNSVPTSPFYPFLTDEMNEMNETDKTDKMDEATVKSLLQ